MLVEGKSRRQVPEVRIQDEEERRQALRLTPDPKGGLLTLQIIYVFFAKSLFSLYVSFMGNLLLFTCWGSEQTRGGSDGNGVCQRLLDFCRPFDVRRGTSGRGTGVMSAERAQGMDHADVYQSDLPIGTCE